MENLKEFVESNGEFASYNHHVVISEIEYSESEAQFTISGLQFFAKIQWFIDKSGGPCEQFIDLTVSELKLVIESSEERFICLNADFINSQAFSKTSIEEQLGDYILAEILKSHEENHWEDLIK